MKINPEISSENAAAQRKYGVQGYPTVVFLSANGNMISAHSGDPGPERFAQLMEEILKDEEKFRQLKIDIQKNPDNPQMNAELALIYAKRGNVEEGQPFIDKALQLDPNNKTGLLPELHVNLGLHYGQNTNGENDEAYFQKAETHFSTVVQKYPQSESYEVAQLYLGITYALQEKFQKAIDSLEKLKDAKDPVIKQRAAQFLDQVKSMAESTK